MDTVAIASGVIGIVIATLMVMLVVRGASSPSQVVCPPNQWTVIINNFGTGMPRTWLAQLTTHDGSPVQGYFRETRAQWIFMQPPVTGMLQPQMQFSRHWINARYVLEICPSAPTTIQLS